MTHAWGDRNQSAVSWSAVASGQPRAPPTSHRSSPIRLGAVQGFRVWHLQVQDSLEVGGSSGGQQSAEVLYQCVRPAPHHLRGGGEQNT